MVIAGLVEGQFADELAGVVVDDADVEVVDEQGDGGAGEVGAEAEVMQAGVVAEADGSPAVDLVVPDSVVGGDDRSGRDGFGSGCVGLGGGAAVQRPVGSDLVVVGLEAVELVLQHGQGGGRWLRRQPFAELAAQAGFGSLTTVAGYAASLFALLAIPIGLFAAGRISTIAADEQARLLTVVFSASVSRRRWFLTETTAVVAGAAVLAVGAGVATWAGAAAVGADVSGPAAVVGTLNVLPVAWLSLGCGVAGLGLVAARLLPIGALPAAGGFVLQVFAERFRWPDWVLWFSPYQHLNAVPYESVDWAGGAAM